MKDHLRHEPRTCGLACTGFLRGAGTVLQAYMERTHARSTPGALLFPEWAPGSVATAVPASEAAFKSALRGLARQAGMPEELVLRLRPRSLRAGGCTDYLASGLVAEAWVQQQGGWRSAVFKIYYRPHQADFAYMHRKLAAVAALSAE